MSWQYPNSRKFWVTVLIFYMVFILGASLKPVTGTEESSWIGELLHNLCHVPAYSVLVFWIVGLLKAWDVKSGIFVKAVIFAALYGILLEFLQGFVPGRTLSVGDMLLNTAGALIMVSLIQRGFMRRFLDKIGKQAG